PRNVHPLLARPAPARDLRALPTRRSSDLAEPAEDGSGPAGWQIKGNAGSMLFHNTDSPSYEAVRAEVWFESEEAAKAAGFAHWEDRKSTRLNSSHVKISYAVFCLKTKKAA